MSLAETVAVVTGGTGALGSAVVALLLAEGVRVAVPHQRIDDLVKLRERIGAANAAPLTGALLDLLDEAAVAAFYQHVAEQQGGLDIVVNIAGGFGGGQPLHETPWSLWQQQLDTNLKTTVLSCQSAIPHLIVRGGGAIVNVGTRTATEPAANLGAYAASKRAVLQLTETLASELRDYNISVNSILPSTIDTPANRAASPNEDHSRWVPPEAIARVVRFLVSSDARIVSGAHIPVYGRA